MLYEATVSTGLESISRDEVLEKLGVESSIQQGKIRFKTGEPVKRLLELKSICNLFVIIYDSILDEDDMPTNEQSLESLLFRVSDQCQWKSGLYKWQETNDFHCPIDQVLTNDKSLKEKQPKFRVSCNRYGMRHKFQSPQVCKIFGHVLDSKFGWPIKMKDYDLEVYANFNENQLTVSLTLTPLALDRRNIVSAGYTTLRAATCYALLRLARIECGDIVIDPMCGSGAIPVECCASWNDEWLAYTMAGEIEYQLLEKSRTNLAIFDTARPPTDMLALDVTSLPFRTNSIDVYISDLPFGRRHGSKSLNRTLYPALLREMARTARLESGRAVLLTQDVKNLTLAFEMNKDYWTQKSLTTMKVGNLVCKIFLLIRNSTVFTTSDE